MKIPQDSPLRLTYSALWHMRTNDEGVPYEDDFHALVNNGKIKVIAPARRPGYVVGRSVLLSSGQPVEADLVILATGYASTWNGIFDEKTADELGCTDTVPPFRWTNGRTIRVWQIRLPQTQKTKIGRLRSTRESYPQRISCAEILQSMAQCLPRIMDIRSKSWPIGSPLTSWAIR